MRVQTLAPAILYFASVLLTVAAPGDPDVSFDPDADGSVTSIALMPDGLIIIGGTFDHVGGQARGGIARVDPEGVVDELVLPPGDGNANCLLVMDDGKIVMGGAFTTVGGFTRNCIARLNAQGGLDSTFNPNLNNFAYSMAQQTDGKLVVTGGFTATGGITRNRMLRLNVDGSLDSFNPNANDIVRNVAILPGGGMVIAGNFTSVGGVSRNHCARLLPAGTVDPAFNPNVNGIVYCLALQPDGNVVIGGAFTSAGGAARTNMARLRPDGTADPSFIPSANGIVRNIAVQTNGKLIAGGNFTQMNGAPCGRLARLNADGTLDLSFSRTGANNVISTTALDSRGRIIAGGDFSALGTVSRSRLARFENEPAVQALTIRGNDRVVWLRSGTSLEAQHVTFELSTGNDTWSPLGFGTRIPGGWELAGLNLPTGATVRARARVVSGIYNGSSGLIEATSLPPLENWRLSHFGTADNTGAAANEADPDSDGLENLVEFAFAGDPNVPDTTILPAWQLSDDDYILTFTRPANVSGVTYVAEYSTSLEAESWIAVSNTGTPPNYAFYVPAISQRLYLRMRVTVP